MNDPPKGVGTELFIRPIGMPEAVARFGPDVGQRALRIGELADIVRASIENKALGLDWEVSVTGEAGWDALFKLGFQITLTLSNKR